MTTIYLARHAHAPLEQRRGSIALGRGRRVGARTRSPTRSIPNHGDLFKPIATRDRDSRTGGRTPGLQPQLIADLRERELPPVGADEFERVVEETFLTPDVSVRGGEPNATAQARGLTVMGDLIERHEGEHIVVSTHGTLLALILNAFDRNYGYDFWQTLSFPDVYVLEADEQGPSASF